MSKRQRRRLEKRRTIHNGQAKRRNLLDPRVPAALAIMAGPPIAASAAEGATSIRTVERAHHATTFRHESGSLSLSERLARKAGERPESAGQSRHVLSPAARRSAKLLRLEPMPGTGTHRLPAALGSRLQPAGRSRRRALALLDPPSRPRLAPRPRQPSLRPRALRRRSRRAQ